MISLKKEASLVQDSGTAKLPMTWFPGGYTDDQVLAIDPTWGEIVTVGPISGSGTTVRRVKKYVLAKCFYGAWTINTGLSCTGNGQLGTFLTADHIGSVLSGPTSAYVTWAETYKNVYFDADQKTVHHYVAGYFSITGAGNTTLISREKGFNFQAFFY